MLDQFHRVNAEGRAEEPIARIGRTAPLDVAKNRHACLGTGGIADHRRDVVPDAAIPPSTRGVGLQDGRAILARDCLGDDDEGKIAPCAAHRLDVTDDGR